MGSWGRNAGLLGTTVIVSKVGSEEAAREMHTLSMTFSSEFGQSIAKQTKRRSVSG